MNGSASSPTEASAQLEALAQSLGITKAELASAETPEYLRLSLSSFDATKLRSLNASILHHASEYFGTSVRLVISAGGLPIFELTVPVVDAHVEQAHRECTLQDRVSIELAVDKSSLCRSWGAVREQRSVVRFYFFGGELSRRLSDALGRPHEAAALFWGNRLHERCDAFIGDTDVVCEGPLLRVRGVSRWDEATADAGELKEVAVVKSMHEQVTRARGRQEWTTGVTPLHFGVAVSGSDPEGIGVALQSLAANLAACYLGGRVDSASSPWMVHLAAERGRVEIPLLGAPLAPVEAAQGVPNLLEFCRWAFEHPHQSDRLRIVQSAVVRRLRDEDGGVSLLTRRAAGIKESADWGLRSFVDERITRYSEEERELQGQVAEMVNSLEEQVVDIAKGTSSAVLAAVAALLGSMLASVFGKDFNPTVFRIGMYTYAAYLLLFPGVVTLWQQWFRFDASRNVFGDRRKRFADAIGQARVRDAAGNRVEDAERRFKRSLRIAAVAMAVVLLACIIAAHQVPPLIASAGP